MWGMPMRIANLSMLNALLNIPPLNWSLKNLNVC